MQRLPQNSLFFLRPSPFSTFIYASRYCRDARRRVFGASQRPVGAAVAAAAVIIVEAIVIAAVCSNKEVAAGRVHGGGVGGSDSH